jgi:hypothetical protein
MERRMWTPDDALDALQPAPVADDLATRLHAPRRDLTRSPAAARTAQLAAHAGLFLFHFEHRYPLDLPDDWVDPRSAEDAEPPRWHDGRLPERKYQSFRHDLLLGSFHPGHRGKWSTHELCHGLVGFAWRPDASPLFHATAGRLAELLPVVLYYFLDEIGLTRCPRHAGGGPLYRSYCADCEQVATMRRPTPDDRAFAADAARFLDRELAAVARTRRLGRPVEHRHATLDLCSDGLAYAAAHGRRLASPAMAHLQPFLVDGGGWSSTLEALEARVVAVARAIVLGEPLAPVVDDPASGRDRWIRQDLAFRMLTVWSECSDDAATAVLSLVERLHDAPVEAIVDGWRTLTDAFVLPSAEQVFAVGYPLADVGRSDAQVLDGLRSVCPLVVELADDAGIDVAGFPDPPVRAPLGDRFTTWLADAHPDLAPLAAFETAVRTVPADPLREQLGPAGTGAVLCDGARVLTAPYDVLATAEAVERGDVAGVRHDDRVLLEPSPPAADWAMVIGRHAGELVLLDIDTEDAAALTAGRPVAVADDLVAHGVMRPERHDL